MSHFTKDELIRSRIAQERGIPNDPPASVSRALDFTLAGMERVRAALDGKAVLVSSGYRSPELNAAVGGAKNSQHMRGEAVDFTCPDFGDPQKIVEALTKVRYLLGIDQMILEHGWVHVSFTLAPRYSVLRGTSGGGTEPLA